LDHRHLHAELRGPDGTEISAGAGPDHDEIVKHLAAQLAPDGVEKDFCVGGDGLKYLLEAGVDAPEASIHRLKARIHGRKTAVDLLFEPIDLGFHARQAILHLDLLALLTQLIRTDLPQVRLYLLHLLPEKSEIDIVRGHGLLSLSQIQHESRGIL